MCCTCTLFHFCLSVLSTYPNKSTNTNKPISVIHSSVSLSLCQELMKGQRGLAWRGDEPEGLKTHTVYTQSTHTPADCTKDSCTASEEGKAFTAVRPGSSEVDSGMWSQSSVLSAPGQVLVKTAAAVTATHAHAQLSVTSADRAEASEPPVSPACTVSLQRHDATEGLRPAAAPVSKTWIKTTLTARVPAWPTNNSTVLLLTL